MDRYAVTAKALRDGQCVRTITEYEDRAFHWRHLIVLVAVIDGNFAAIVISRPSISRHLVLNYTGLDVH
jgi:hypothetical protein